ncbi:hypothetical protein DPMN_099952 [Dreissena polymorpha]|uniref:Uncharacterized protein n=1 Tax=Dreissena polymorpha TaxID=45954 RepID=A0A9D4LF08_DREPO|nr:hypothetical protein DPMN_099952 [Dreissena polymorpha]
MSASGFNSGSPMSGSQYGTNGSSSPIGYMNPNMNMNPFGQPTGNGSTSTAGFNGGGQFNPGMLGSMFPSQNGSFNPNQLFGRK